MYSYYSMSDLHRAEVKDSSHKKQIGGLDNCMTNANTLSSAFN